VLVLVEIDIIALQHNTEFEFRVIATSSPKSWSDERDIFAHRWISINGHVDPKYRSQQASIQVRWELRNSFFNSLPSGTVQGISLQLEIVYGRPALEAQLPSDCH
jgi:hypothetical protein